MKLVSKMISHNVYYRKQTRKGGVMKTLIVCLIILLCSSKLRAQEGPASVNSWSLIGFLGNIDSLNTKSSLMKSFQLFVNYGTTEKNGGWFIQSEWVKTFSQCPIVPDTLAVRCKFVNGSQNISEIRVRIAIQDSNTDFFSGYESNININDTSWQIFKWDMSYVKTFMTKFLKLYLVFLTITPDSTYTGSQIGVSRLWGINNGDTTIYDNFGGTTGISKIQPQVNGFELKQNYPNPFNPTSTISYAVPKTVFVTLKVYDVLGKEVATLVNEEKPAGNYNSRFDSSGLASGMYIYRLTAGAYTETKKMILMK